MAKRLVGLDIGSYSVKAIVLDPRDYSVLEFEEELIVGADANDTNTFDEEEFERAQTQVREAPQAPDEATEGEDGNEVDETVEQAASSEHELDSLPEWASAVLRLIDRLEAKDDLFAVQMPGNQAIALQIEVPFSDQAKVRSILPSLLMDRLPFDVDEVTLDFRLQGGEAEPEALVAFTRSTQLARLLDDFESLELNPTRVCVAELMLATAGFDAMDLHEGSTAVLDVGHHYTRFVVFEGRDILMARSIKSGGHAITQRIAEELNVSYERAQNLKHDYAAIVADTEPVNEEMRTMSHAIAASLKPLVRDLRRSLQGLYARQKVEVTRIYLTGGTARIKNIVPFLQNELGVAIERLNAAPLTSKSSSPLALALANTFRDGSRRHVLDLRQGPFVYRGSSSYLRRQFMLLGAAAAVIFLMTGVALFLQKQAYDAQRDAVRATLEKQTQEVLGEKLTSTSEIRRRLAGEDGAVKSFVPRMSAYELMFQVTSKIAPEQDLTLRRFEVDVDRRLVQLMGDTTDPQAVDKLVGDLEQIECLRSIKKDKLNVGRDGRADFELQISSDCS